jgi:3,4-dihydroxy 2-butanone 4-phosphate synthase/GTP cyclohydrolase II
MSEYKFNTIAEAVEDIRNGKMIIVVDNEDRENEGDIIMAAEKVTGEAMNFIATYAKGLICLPTSKEIAEKLKIEEMCKVNTDNHCTAFTETIDHVDTTTGISAFERAYTVNKFVCDDAKPEDFRRPGHIFPLIAKERGVLERNGHTEATVDLARLAGLKPAGICCEIMSDDGHMARTPELMEMSKKWGLKIITVEALIEYIKENNCSIEKAVTTTLPTRYGIFKVNGYYDRNNGQHHLALYMGDIADGEPVLARVHSECLTGDALGSVKCDCGQQYDAAMKKIAETGRGVLVYMRQEGRGIGLINKLKAYALQEQGMDTVEANLALGFPEDLRNYDIAAQILGDLEVNEVKLMTNNPDKIKKLEENGVKIIERVPIQVEHYKEADFYLHTKKAKMGHILNF